MKEDSKQTDPVVPDDQHSSPEEQRSHSRSDSDQSLAGQDQSLADREQTLADSDQSSSERDQLASDADQVAADRDAANLDNRYADSLTDYHVSRVQRLSGTAIRHAARDERDGAAQTRDQIATSRAENAANRDRLGETQDRIDAAFHQAADRIDVRQRVIRAIRSALPDGAPVVSSGDGAVLFTATEGQLDGVLKQLRHYDSDEAGREVMNIRMSHVPVGKDETFSFALQRCREAVREGLEMSLDGREDGSQSRSGTVATDAG